MLPALRDGHSDQDLGGYLRTDRYIVAVADRFSAVDRRS